MSDVEFINLAILLTLPVTYLFTNLVKVISIKAGFVNHPNPIVETHKVSIPYGGGIAIGLSVIIFLAFQSINLYFALSFLMVLLPVIFVGILDDFFRFSPLIKFALQIAVNAPFLFLYISYPFHYLPIVLLLILATQNSWNLIDVMDGLLAGVSSIVFIASSIILYQITELKFYSHLSMFIGFSVIGFRLLNQYPAKIFLGETGSFLLGSLFGFIVIGSFFVNTLIAGYLILLGSIPFFELFFLIIVRIKKGIPFYKGSPDHFALRLLAKGFSVKKINRYVLLTSLIQSIIVISANHFLPDKYFFVCLSITLIGGVIAYLYFNSFPAKEIKVDQ